jgi:EmrB/QacA subfamily drug resistance transporter
MAVDFAEAAPRAASPAIATTQTKTSASWVLALTSVASFMVALDALVVATALSTIRVDFGASIEALQWTVNAYNLSFAMLLLTGAALGDHFGRRRMFVIGLTIFTAASAACALAPRVEWLIAARALQGAGGAMVMPLAMALLSAAFPAEERAKALGLYSGVTGLALIGGPVIGGAIVQGIAWHWIFWLNIPIGLITIALTFGRVDGSRGPTAGLDIGGLVLASSASLALVWGLVRANAAGWLSTEVASALGVGLALGVAFVLFELRARAPMIPMSLFRSRAFSAGNTACFLFTAALYGTLFFVAQFLQTAQGYAPLQTGLRLLPWTATLFIVAPFAGRLVNRIGERPLIVIGLFLQALGFAWVRMTVAPDVAFISLAVPLIVAGAGISMAMPAAQNSVLSAVSRSEVGKASGTYNSVRFLGGALGIALSASVFASAGGFGTPELFSTGFAASLGVSALLSLGGAVAGTFVPARAARAQA